MKVGLSEIRDKLEEVQMGESRPRGSGEPSQVQLQACCFDPAHVPLMIKLLALLSSVSSGELMVGESMLSLRGSSASLRRSQWSLRGQ